MMVSNPSRFDDLKIRLFFALLLGATVYALPTNGQEPLVTSAKTIVSQGSSEILLSPQKLRLLMKFKIESRDGPSALEALRGHQSRVSDALKTSQAESSTLTFALPIVTVGTPGIDDPDSARRVAQQRSAQLRGLNARGGAAVVEEADILNLPQVFTATNHVIADWILPNEINESALLLPSQIKTLIEEKDLLGKRFRVTLDEEEQSKLQPLLGAISFVSSSRDNPAPVVLVFVAEPTDKQEEEAYAKAFEKAKQQAGLVASASGLKLGAVRTIQRSYVSDGTLTSYSSVTGQWRPAQSFTRNDREVVHPEPHGLKRFVGVQVVFDQQ